MYFHRFFRPMWDGLEKPLVILVCTTCFVIQRTRIKYFHEMLTQHKITFEMAPLFVASIKMLT